MTTMNKHIQTTFLGLLLLLGLSISSCKGLLDLPPIDHHSEGSFWTSKAQVEANLIALHSDLRGRYSVIRAFGELRAGTMKVGTAATGEQLQQPELKRNLLSAERVSIEDWGGLYTCILRVNLFIKKVSDDCPFLSEDERRLLLGKGYGLRAYYYFLLYRAYGGVPLETEPVVATKPVGSTDHYYKARSSAQQTLELIRQDIDRSETLLASSAYEGSKMEWTLGATKMLKAEIYLWSAKVTTGDHTATGATDLAIARRTLEELINSNKYQLESNFASIFDPTKRGGDEVILALYFDRNEATNDYREYLYNQIRFAGTARDLNGDPLPDDPLNIQGTGRLFNEYKYSLVKSFDETDTRRAATFFEFQAGRKAPYRLGSVMKKYIGRTYPDGKHIYDSQIILYRYADALLMLAEVKNALGEDPSVEINAIRQRAYGAAFAGHEYTHTTAEAAELAILQERTKEFVGEYKRFFDLIRLQDGAKKPLVFSIEGNYPDNPNLPKASTPVLSEDEAYKVLWPIDREVMSQDPKIKQTPGY
jgi:hypothetical protein